MLAYDVFTELPVTSKTTTSCLCNMHQQLIAYDQLVKKANVNAHKRHM